MRFWPPAAAHAARLARAALANTSGRLRAVAAAACVQQHTCSSSGKDTNSMRAHCHRTRHRLSVQPRGRRHQDAPPHHAAHEVQQHRRQRERRGLQPAATEPPACSTSARALQQPQRSAAWAAARQCAHARGARCRPCRRPTPTLPHAAAAELLPDERGQRRAGGVAGGAAGAAAQPRARAGCTQQLLLRQQLACMPRRPRQWRTAAPGASTHCAGRALRLQLAPAPCRAGVHPPGEPAARGGAAVLEPRDRGAH